MKSRMKPALRAVPAAPVQLSLNVQGVLRDVQQAFYGLCVNAGKQVLAAMMEADRVALCGTKNVHDTERKAVRGGTTRSSVVLGGQRVAIAKPRGTQPGARRAGIGHLCVGGGHRPAGHGHAGLAGRRGIHAALRRHLGTCCPSPTSRCRCPRARCRGAGWR